MTAQEYIDACSECRTPQRAAELLRVGVELANDDIRVRDIAQRLKECIERERAAHKAAVEQYDKQVARLSEQVEELTAELEDKRIQLAELGSLSALIGRLGAVTLQSEAAAGKLVAALAQQDAKSAAKPQQDKSKPKPKKQVSKKTDSKEQRSKYGEYKHVLLTGTQYARLVKEFGAKKTDEYIRKVDEYCQQTGKSYNDYNLTIRKFMRDDNAAAKPAEQSDSGDHSYDLDKLLDHAKKQFNGSGKK